jgi:hypothetical protein
MFDLFRNRLKAPDQVIHPYNNMPLRFTHSETMLRLALKPYLGDEYQSFRAREWRHRFEYMRRECFFFQSCPDYCAHMAWGAYYRVPFDTLIESFRDSLPSAIFYTQSDLLDFATALLPLLPSSHDPEELVTLLPTHQPYLSLSSDGIYKIACALFSALPDCRHPHDDHQQHLWFCRRLELNEASRYTAAESQ